MFHDNLLLSRFESFHNGVLAAYLTYELRGGKLRLLKTVVQRQFHSSDSDVRAELIRQALLQAHRRRLSVVPVGGSVTLFLMQYPQYRQLIAAAERGSTAVTSAGAGRHESHGI